MFSGIVVNVVRDVLLLDTADAMFQSRIPGKAYGRARVHSSRADRA